MKRPVFTIILFLAGFPVLAQSIALKSGASVAADGMQRSGAMLTVSVKTPNGSTGQVGYQVADIARLYLPPPPAFAEAQDLISRGKYDQAVAKIDPVVVFQKTLADIPGNLWAKAALIEVSALASLNRQADADALANQIVLSAPDPETLTAAKLQLALTTKFADPDQAIAAFDGIISQCSEPLTLSQAWIAEGDIHFGQHEYADALLDYLSVNVLFPDRNPYLAKALWGSGRTYAKLKDPTNAVKVYQQLVAAYPATPEAALAQSELIKKEQQK